MGKLVNKTNKNLVKLKKMSSKVQKNLFLSKQEELEYKGCLKKLRGSINVMNRYNNYDVDLYEEKFNYYYKVYIKHLNKRFDQLTRKFGLNIKFSDFERRYKDQFLKYTFDRIIKQSGISKKIFNKEFTKHIPNRPKDEYPEARSIKRKFIIHAGPTNSGKTYSSIEKLKTSENGMYLSPLRLLALEVYEKFNLDGVPCDLLTGEESVNIPGSRHISATVEKADFKTYFDLVVIDECQLVNDSSRGNGWTRAILGILAKEIHLCCSLNSVELLKEIIADCEDECEVIYHKRQTPLIVEKELFQFPDDVRDGDALIAFSRRSVLGISQELKQLGINTSVIYGSLPPESRRDQINKFNNKDTTVIVSTDAIGMGVNLPIKRIVFLEDEKFDGTSTRPLTSQEVKQIAGRAGRIGIYPDGFVTAAFNSKFIKKQLNTKDKDLTTSMISPSEESLLNIHYGDLEKKLLHWNMFNYKSPYIKKSDLSEQLYLLSVLPQNIKNRLSERELYRIIYIPFDVKRIELVRQWIEYAKQIANNVSDFKKPTTDLYFNLYDLETCYHKVNLYYSVSKAFNKTIDIDWVTSKREYFSSLIVESIE